MVLNTYLKMGWSVIPILPRNKTPAIPWEIHQRTRADSDQIRIWWEKNPQYNVGIITGPISKLVVIDIDGPDGEKALVEKFPDLPDTLSCQTGRGGRHLYFRYEKGDIPCIVGLFDHVDIRAAGGLVIAPPSTHENGHKYKWINPTTPIAPMPERVKEFILARRQQNNIDWTADIQKGQRDEYLTRLAGVLLKDKKIPIDEVTTLLQAINQKHCQPPLEPNIVQKIIKSIASREDQKIIATPNSGFELTSFELFMNDFANSEVRWLIHNWLPVGAVGKIVGPPESYKTWIILDLAFSIASGTKFLNKYDVLRKGPVIIFQQEDGNENLGRRLNLITCNRMDPKYFGNGADVDKYEWLHLPPHLPIFIKKTGMLEFDNPNSIKQLTEAVRKIKPVLVVLDPLYSAVSTKDYMMEAARTMLTIKDIREEFGTSFLFGHHSVKSGNSGEREEGWGSQFLNAFDEFQWQVRVKGQSTVLIKRRGKTAEPQPDIQANFNISMSGGAWRYLVDTDIAAENTLEVMYGRIRQMYAMGLTYRQIQDELKVGPATVKKAIAEED